MVRLTVYLIVLLVIVDAALSVIQNTTLNDIKLNELMPDTRRRRAKKSRSTSSSSGDKRRGSSSTDKSSLELSTFSSSTSRESRGKKYKKPKSSLERRGWRKWHRKCQKCPEDMWKKWRDPSIEWICGAYQRARRSFKSRCMMHYRNCQDGTMFVKISNHRCPNSTGNEYAPHGDHFFYEYKASLTDDSTSSTSSTSTSESHSTESLF